MALPPAPPQRTPRAWFFDVLTGGLYKRFNTGNLPDKSTFKALTDSFLNPIEASDTASTDNAGHVKISSDSDAATREAGVSDYHTRVVRPHQLSNMETSDGTEVVTKDVAVAKGGIIITAIEKVIGSIKRRNFRFALNLGGSMKITNDKLELDGDQIIAEGVTDMYYGQQTTTKGWFTFLSALLRFIPNWVWTGGATKVLSSNGVAMSWIPPTSGGTSGYEPDNETVKLNAYNKLAVKTQPVSAMGSLQAPVIFPSANGLYVKIDGQTLGYTTAGALRVNSGGVASDKVIIADDFVETAISDRWGNENAAIVPDDINGAVLLETTLLPQSAHIVQRPGISYILNPIVEARIRLDFDAAIQVNSPDIYIGIIGDGSSVTLGDFVGFTIDKATGFWKGIVMVNGSIVDSVMTSVAVDGQYQTFKVELTGTEGAALKINSEDEFTFADGVCNFHSEQNCGVYLINVIADSNNVYIDYVNTSRNRDVSPFN